MYFNEAMPFYILPCVQYVQRLCVWLCVFVCVWPKKCPFTHLTAVKNLCDKGAYCSLVHFICCQRCLLDLFELYRECYSPSFHSHDCFLGFWELFRNITIKPCLVERLSCPLSSATEMQEKPIPMWSKGHCSTELFVQHSPLTVLMQCTQGMCSVVL